jgi:hypothetical protein
MAKTPEHAMGIFTSDFNPSGGTSNLGSGRPLIGDFAVGVLPPYSEQKDLDGNVVSFIGDVPLSEIKEIMLVYVLSAKYDGFKTKMTWINDYCKTR